ncbi:MAG: COX15/CtaA family protein [Planctomycetota bacterium]|nr:COX15/CtaA family protein [Planctomycetota bacterium]
MKNDAYNRPLHRLALLTAGLTFPLIFLGGLVTSKHAGMSVPDWPNTWGYNMFTFPPSKWVGGILYEHTHRLLASAVGFMTIVLATVAWVTDRRPLIRWTSVALILAVCVQGVIGGLRVVLSDLDLAIAHGCAGQLFFCFAATFCVLTSALWTQKTNIPDPQLLIVRSVLRFSLVTTAIVFGQLVIGAIMRHSGAGLAIPDFPTSYGAFFPPVHIDNAFRRAAIHHYGADLGINQVTPFQIWIHFAHRIGAVFVSGAVIVLSATILSKMRRLKTLARPAIGLLVLLGIQVTLGILTVLLHKPADIASAHVAVGALVLMTTWVIAVRSYSVLRNAPASVEQADQPGSTARAAHLIGALSA